MNLILIINLFLATLISYDKEPESGYLYNYINLIDHKKDELKIYNLKENKKDLEDFYEKLLKKKINKIKKKYESFYIICEVNNIYWKDSLFQKKVFRCSRLCPVPTTNQSVYFYDSKTDSLKIMWILPSEKLCNEYGKDIEDIPLFRIIDYILAYKAGTLDKIALNANPKE